ncbi:efflux RND transporter periplasmic adaptor subunit [Sphingomonas sp. R-74633]|uniref:efflux RND transporter periplasmic adaptor subunit n=1 Tax=Sphingomonas sp. R-74633 TaxID=2751188 RepID=UPI0015D12BC2|nr:efflux RND transporter periplasmic adaptor subunit [Sphingomonas sp. R-74633]NYT40833.1 efflux RND transporter periplasmic adaptor subunit [Sphingomonas sp. R-74633]
MYSKNRQLLIPALAATLALAGCGGGGQQPPQQGAPPVTVSAPLVQDVVDWDEFVGRFEAVQNVEVRPRATGYLQGVWFKDGQYVQKGQLLFTIDPRPAQAAVAQAAAQLAQAQATLANAQTEYARSEALVAQRAASQEELEQRRAALRSGSAQVAAAQANLRARKLDLGFTRVVAPLSGRISERKVDVGNTVATDQTVLTTIVSVDPLHFVFQGSEALLLKYQRQGTGDRNGTPVKIKLSDESEYSHSGTLDFVDNALDAGAGTIRARAIVSNPGGFLKPGMFGSARLEASRPYPALLVPDTAVMADAARQIVFVVDKSNTVTARPVQTGPLRGNLRVIRSGITKDDRVIIDGTQRARPGVKVTPQPGKITETAAASAPPSDAPASTALPAGNR